MPELSLLLAYQRIAMSPLARREAPPTDDQGRSWEPDTLHDAVIQPATALRGLEDVKAYAKGRYLLDKKATENDRSAYLAVYISAIAAALRWHATSITNLPLIQLVSALVWASRQDWLPTENRELCDPKRLIDALTANMVLSAKKA